MSLAVPKISSRFGFQKSAHKNHEMCQHLNAVTIRKHLDKFLARPLVARMNADRIAAAFVPTYYRIVYRSHENLMKLYDSRAAVSRFCAGQKVVVHSALRADALFGHFTCRVIKVCTFSATKAGQGVIINVHGSANDVQFTQTFVLREVSDKYVIISDNYYEFGDAMSTVGTEIGGSLRDFVPTRTIMVKGVTSGYSGDEIRDIYAQFGMITRQFYAYNVAYIEYASDASVDAAISLRSIHRGVPLRAEPLTARGGRR